MITFFSVSKSSLAERGAEDVGQDVEGRRKILGQAGDVIERVFLGGLGVVLGADPVEVAIDRQRHRARAVPLNVMCSRKCETPARSRRLVAASRLDEEARGDRVRPVVQLGDDLEAVVECRVMKLSWDRP